MIDELIAFLNARLDEREAAALAADPGPWEFEGDDPTDDELFTVHNGEHGDLVGNTVAFTRGRNVANGRHMALHDPDRTLREVKADRQLLREYQRLLGWRGTCESHRRAMPHRTPFTAPGWPSEYELQREEAFIERALPLMEGLLRAKAAVHASHPDYPASAAPTAGSGQRSGPSSR